MFFESPKSEESPKCLGRVFDKSLTDKGMRGSIFQKIPQILQAIEAPPLQGRFKLAMKVCWMLNNSADSKVRMIKPLLGSGKKIRAQYEIDESLATLMLEEVRDPIQMGRYVVGWNHFPQWSQASSSVRFKFDSMTCFEQLDNANRPRFQYCCNPSDETLINFCN